MAAKLFRELAKTEYLAGLQCHKLLWFTLNKPDLIVPADANAGAVFEQGLEVGELAKTLFPNGREVGRGIFDRESVWRYSKEALSARVPLFEAGFAGGGAYARVDILDPVKNDSWDIVEVKSCTKVEDEHRRDVALQWFVCSKAGLRINKCYIVHVNNAYLRRGAIDARRLLVKENVTAEVKKFAWEVRQQLRLMLKIAGMAKSPEVTVGAHCETPYRCCLHGECWKKVPRHNVFTLHRGRVKAESLIKKKVWRIQKIPHTVKLSENQEIQRKAVASGKAQVNRAAISAFLKNLRYPLSYLDFESFATAIPKFDKAKPYQQIPFQFSLHVARRNSSRLKHYMYLADGTGDPRAEFMKQLRKALPAAGSVIVYNASFELERLKECAKLLPKHAKWCKRVTQRVVDLHTPFRSFDYYHPDQQGSTSIKKVLPALTCRGYKGLPINDGAAASRQFLRVTFEDVPLAEKRSVRGDLKEYCGRDTMAMFWIVQKLRTTCA